jgi:hypothetical protein
MKLSELRQIIKEELEETLDISEMRPARGFKLNPNWENMIDVNSYLGKKIKDAVTKKSNTEDTIYTIEDFFGQAKGGTSGYMSVLTGISKIKKPDGTSEIIDKFNGDDTKRILANTDVKFRKGQQWSKQEKPESSGVMGRPKTIDDTKKMLGLGVTMKYAKGSMDFSPEEVEFIKTLYKSIKGK